MSKSLRVRWLQSWRRHLIEIPSHEILLRHLQVVRYVSIFCRVRLNVSNILRRCTTTKIQLVLLNALMTSRFENKLILCVDQVRIVLRLNTTVVRYLILEANLCLMSGWNIYITCHACCTQTIVQVFWTLIPNAISKTLELVLNLRDWILCCIREIGDHSSIVNIHCLVTYLQALFYMWTSLRLLNVTTNCVVLSKARCLSTIRSISTFSEILKLAIISWSGTDLLNITLRVINCPIRIMMSCRCSGNLIRTIPLVSRSTHAFQVVVSNIGCILLIRICHTNTIDMLWLSFAYDRAHWLRHVIWAHWGILLSSWSIILVEVHLIHVANATLSHLIFRWHGYLTSFIRSIWRLVHHLHLLVTEAAHFIIMHYKNKLNCQLLKSTRKWVLKHKFIRIYKIIFLLNTIFYVVLIFYCC